MSLKSQLGNERIKGILFSYLAKNRLPQAVVFAGPPGVGKLSFALNLAKAAICVQGEGDACDACKTCRTIEGLIFPDVMVLNPEGQGFRKGQIDNLVEESRLKPLSGKYRFFVLDGADLMNDSAANAFLKTLEEPAPANVFLLLVENPRLLLPTIRSRCQILNFLPLSRSLIEASLQEKGFTPEKARFISRIVQESHGGVDKLNWPELEEKRREAMRALSALLRQKGVEDILLGLNDRSRNRDSFVSHFSDTLRLISSFLRDIMVLLIDPKTEALINLDYQDELMDMTRFISLENTYNLLDKLEALKADVARHLNARLLSISLISGFTDQRSA